MHEAISQRSGAGGEVPPAVTQRKVEAEEGGGEGRKWKNNESKTKI